MLRALIGQRNCAPIMLRLAFKSHDTGTYDCNTITGGPNGLSTTSLTDCWEPCWNNCSCTAYRMTGGQFCAFRDALFNFIPGRSFSSDFYVLNCSLPTSKENKWWIWMIVGLGTVLLMLLFGLSVYYFRKNLIGRQNSLFSVVIFLLFASLRIMVPSLS